MLFIHVLSNVTDILQLLPKMQVKSNTTIKFVCCLSNVTYVLGLLLNWLVETTTLKLSTKRKFGSMGSIGFESKKSFSHDRIVYPNMWAKKEYSSILIYMHSQRFLIWEKVLPALFTQLVISYNGNFTMVTNNSYKRKFFMKQKINMNHMNKFPVRKKIFACQNCLSMVMWFGKKNWQKHSISNVTTLPRGKDAVDSFLLTPLIKIVPGQIF